MTSQSAERLTTINRQEKAALIWAIADKLVGVYKPHEYGNVILPMCVIKRFEDTLAPTREAVWKKNEELGSMDDVLKGRFLRREAGQQFFNTSKFTFQNLLADPDNIADNFDDYLQHFSDNVIDIIRRFEFDKEISKLEDNGLLYLIIKEFNSDKAYLGADRISSVDMGYIFEELVRKFSESYDEQAGAHFTARDIIYVMSDILVAGDEEKLRDEGVSVDIYDMAMGTSQMLGCLTERLTALDPDADVTSHGQELNNQTFAIAKADTLIKGGNADNMRQGDTLGNDQFRGYEFDYIISNPPFGIEWKTSKSQVEKETGEGERFAAGLPAIGDGQMLFTLNGISKLKENGRMAIIQNGSPLFKGDAGGGESNIRGFLLEHDWLDAIIQLPNDLFYNTGIATYIWIVSKEKAPERKGKVQLIDASQCYDKRRKSLGNKRVEITDRCRELIVKAYKDFANQEIEDGEIRVESRIKDVEDFKYRKVFTYRPLRLEYAVIQFDEQRAAGMKGPDIALLKDIASACTDCREPMNDYEFFSHLKKQKVKIAHGKVSMIRNFYGKRNPAMSEAYVKPTDKSSGYAPDSELKDSEIIPWKTDCDEFLEANVRPYAPDFWYDESETKIGYEIPFTREFYRYTAPRPAAEIFEHFRALGKREQELMTKILGK
ncbi:class I SAM-dependent DNA methyltransferase [uncultured Duncaniella sp.]|uniref:type I restriction-modification system subunit M n=1 Tax=uncultured Duncaniella sp. TaxID=2768039 RepID=UPI0025B6760A|nr:class I SAM-dependent DNA methyltransferase [uncultured Duncaniella sp.]